MVGSSLESHIYYGKNPASSTLFYLRWYFSHKFNGPFLSDDCKTVNEVSTASSDRKMNHQNENFGENGKGKGGLQQEEHLLVTFKCFSCGSINDCPALNYMNRLNRSSCSNCSNGCKENGNAKSSYFKPKKHSPQSSSPNSAEEESKSSKPRSTSKPIGTDTNPIDTTYYELLSIPVDANQVAIKKAYYNAAMKVLYS
jgi:hypothetical protein